MYTKIPPEQKGRLTKRLILKKKKTDKMIDGNKRRVSSRGGEGLMGSSAADSQLATDGSQLRFQSAAFSSSLQTATQTILDPNNKNKWREESTRTFFKVLTETVTGATLTLFPSGVAIKREKGYCGVHQAFR